MTESISKRIIAAEEKWLELVRIYTAKLFSETFIPSHDQGHHLRVWRICKRLLVELEKFNCISKQDMVEGLLLAAWFHDTGMVIDAGERHGAMGRKIFEEFIRNTPSHKPANYREVIYAIEYHDTKERSAYPDLYPGDPPGILGILSMADDFDALGIVGVYRYSEIYLKRGVQMHLLGIKILSNVSRRFQNILESSAALPALTDLYQNDYQVIEDFFNRYNQQLTTESKPEAAYWGELGVVNYIRRFSVESEIRPEEFTDQPEITTAGGTVISYFNKLHDELGKGNPQLWKDE